MTRQPTASGGTVRAVAARTATRLTPPPPLRKLGAADATNHREQSA